MKNKFIVQEIIMEAKQDDNSVIVKRVKIDGRKRILAEDWEDIENGSSDN